MRYQEFPTLPELAPFVRAVWHLSADGATQTELENDALPDGCVEIIHRLHGRSNWHGEQPEFFVAGLCSAPAKLLISGDAAFVGLRLWPWAWNLIGHLPAGEFHDRWIALEPGSSAAALVLDAGQVIFAASRFFETHLPDPIGKFVPGSASAGEVVEKSGRNHRAVQRWFKTQIGMPARAYFKLLRFQNAIETGGGSEPTLAHEAAALGYSDQAHMARNFREYAGRTTSAVRADANGPFLDRRQRR